MSIQYDVGYPVLDHAEFRRYEINVSSWDQTFNIHIHNLENCRLLSMVSNRHCCAKLSGIAWNCVAKSESELRRIRVFTKWPYFLGKICVIFAQNICLRIFSEWTTINFACFCLIFCVNCAKPEILRKTWYFYVNGRKLIVSAQYQTTKGLLQILHTN